MIKIVYVVCFLITVTSFGNVFSQQYTSESKRAINSFEKGRLALRSRAYDEAVEYFKKAVEKDPSFVEAYLMLGEVFFEKNDYEKVVFYYEQAMNLNPDFFPTGYFVIGNMYLKKGEYEKAKNNYQSFLNHKQRDTSIDKKAKEKLKRAEFGIDALNNPVPFEPRNLGEKVNSKYNEYWPSLSADEQMMVFTVLLPKNKNNPNVFNNRQEDFYYSKKEDGSWTNAKSMGAPLNSNLNEGAQSISADGRYMFFTACNRTDGVGLCDLYFSIREGDEWSAPANLQRPVNSNKKETQPSVTTNGRTLFFASNRGGTKGNLDLWVSHFQEDGTWSNPENLGDMINTEGDEMSPFIHHDNQTLYFCSDGHIGMGGYDLFMSKRDSAGEWQEPQNLGYPINTYKDEIGLIVNTSGELAYFASDRGQDNKDLYQFDLYEAIQPIPASYMKGKVFNEDTKELLGARFELIDLETEEIISASESDPITGEFLVCIPTDRDYALNVDRIGYLFYSDNIALEGVHERIDPFMVDIPLTPLKVGKKIVLRNVFFETDSFTLQPESKVELEKIAGLLEQHPSMKVEISGHTDNVGTEAYNMELSENRAKSAVFYLRKKGIRIDRMIYKGYGENNPIADNDTPQGRAKNRRTELKVIEM
jgi:flagellar motor protein MotB